MTDVIDINHLKNTLREFTNARDWAQFHSAKNLSMALTRETSEMLEIFQWMTEQDSNQAHLDNNLKEKIAFEAADILTYLVMLTDKLNINLSEAITKKLAINNRKYPAELVKGSSKKYNEYRDYVEK